MIDLLYFQNVYISILNWKVNSSRKVIIKWAKTLFATIAIIKAVPQQIKLNNCSLLDFLLIWKDGRDSRMTI